MATTRYPFPSFATVTFVLSGRDLDTDASEGLLHPPDMFPYAITSFGLFRDTTWTIV